MKRLRYYLAAARWLWANRTWANTRQKFKAMEKELRAKMDGEA